MRVMAFDAYVAEERFRELGVERAESSDDVYSRADFITVHLPVHRRDRELAERGRLRRDARRRARDQRGARQADGRGGAARGARLGQGRRRGARRVPRGARHRAPAVRLPQRRGHPAPRRLHRRGHRPRRLPGRRAGRGGAHRRRRDERGEHPGDRGRGPRGARPVPAAGARPRPDRERASPSAPSVDAVEVEYLGRIAERDTRLLTVQVLSGVLAGPHRGGGERRERARVSPTSAGSPSPRRAARTRATSPTSCAWPW